MIKDWLKFNEEKNYGDIYHSLRYANTFKADGTDFSFKNEKELFKLTNKILVDGLRFEKNKHKESTYKHPRLFDYYISTSRDKNSTINFYLAFVLDSRKISNNYRIVPFNKFVLKDTLNKKWKEKSIGKNINNFIPLSRKWSEEKIVSKNPGFLSSIYFKEIILNNLSPEFEDKLKELVSELNLNIKITIGNSENLKKLD